MSWIVFPNARAAVIWAEEFSTRPNVKCPLGNLRQYLTREYGAATREDMLDLALTITGMVSMVEPPAGPMYRAVYGDIDQVRILGMADIMAHLLHKGAESLPIAKLRGLAGGVIRSTIEHERFGRRYGLRRISQDADIDRNTLKGNADWMWAFADAQNTIKTWLIQAERDLTVRMEEQGLLRVDEMA